MSPFEIERFHPVGIANEAMEYFVRANEIAGDMRELARQSYRAWRDRFWVARLRFALVLSGLVAASFLLLQMGRWLFRGADLVDANFWAEVAIVLATLASLRLSLTAWGCRHLRLMFFSICGSVEILPQTIQALFRNTEPDYYGWIATFFAQATLIPLRWPLHLASQILVIGHYFGFNELLGNSVVSPATSRAGVVLQLFWICLICDLAVYLYERLQRSEFRNRRHLTEAYQQLKAAEEKYRSIFENAVEGIFQVGPDGRYVSANPALARILGYDSPEAAIAQLTDVDRQLYANPGRRATLLRLLRRNGRASGFESEVYRADGQKIWVVENTRAIRDETGAIAGYEGTLADISDRKRVEERVRKALEKEKELNQLKSQFVSVISHEFRTPMTAILGAAEALEHYGDRWDAAKKAKYFQRIQTAIRRMTDLLESVLLIGQSESGKLRFQPALLDLEAFCREVLEDMQVAAPGRTIAFQTTGAPDGPVCMDAKLLHHILPNLVSNALKYSPPESPVSVDLRYEGDWGVLVVRDRGIGIPPSDRDRLFDSFHRASNVGARPGTGLGLSIVKQSVELHGGTVAVESEVGQGTAFIATLPLRPPDFAPAPGEGDVADSQPADSQPAGSDPAESELDTAPPARPDRPSDP